MPGPGPHAPTIAVIGGGAAGALTAARLLERGVETGAAVRVVLFEPGEPGRGVAYGTRDPGHRLNVRHEDMTAEPEDPDHFERWRREHRTDEPGNPFAARRDFGRYLVVELDDAEAAAVRTDGRVSLVRRPDRVVELEPQADGRLRLSALTGESLLADHVVLATGNQPPKRTPGLPEETELAGVVADPWAPGALDAVAGAEGTVVLVGSGLTMVDVAITLARTAPAAELLAVSRTGLLPRVHRADPDPPAEPAIRPRDGLRLDEILRAVDDAIAQDPKAWRAVVDGLRPVTQELWRSLPPEDQRTFVADHARAWSIRRHRIAPSVGREFDELLRSGRLRTRAAGVERIAAADTGDGLAVDLAPDDGATERVVASHVVTCTGPSNDYRRAADPLLRGLVDAGLAEPHPLHLGLRTDDDGRLLGPRATGRVSTLGGLRQGDLYESIAVPEIRVQAAGLARALV